MYYVVMGIKDSTRSGVIPLPCVECIDVSKKGWCVMQKSYVHVLVSRNWFDDMFIAGNGHKYKTETCEAFEAYAASMGIVIKFTSSLTLDDGFEFVFPRWASDSDKQEYADKFAYMVENSVEFVVRDGHVYVDPFRMQSVSIRTPFVVNQSKESIIYLESMYRKIMETNPDISNRYKDNHAVFAYILSDDRQGYMNTFSTQNHVKNIDSKLFIDASSKIKDLMKTYSYGKDTKKVNKYDAGNVENIDKYKKETLSKMFDGWRSEVADDGTSGYLNIQRAADNANRKIDEE